MIDHPDISGPVNITSPGPVQMKAFGKTLGSVLRKPHWMPTPGFALKAALGEKSILVLEGQKVLPKKLLSAGFEFQYSRLEEALEQIFSS
ncbi:hypothetical protein GCM10008967_35050 [Bacillus carboniphilus]|uniref:DUF1731 domain-containing protein n=1 Tax=Bacillus carboniphilus TaxID=86663 RepID=A0ABP3GCR1_9BACI